MKYVRTIAFLGFVLTVFIGCASSDSTAPTGPSRPSQPILDGNWTSPAFPAQDPSSPYFTGSGGSGMRLGILVPESSGLNDNQVYLPRVLQGALVSNFSRHSAISVLDRVSLDRVIFETLDPTYEDSLDIVRLGHVAQVAYMMTGNITRTSAGYVLQINVTDTTPNANTIASYSGIHASTQLNDFSAVNNASRELLEQMGVQLTLAATSRLTQASPSQDIGSQTSLARGIVAQQRGTIVEALVHYHNAVAFDPRLLEATDRLSTLSAHVSSGNLGEDVRNEIRWRNEWLRILNEAEEFFNANLPFELVYSPSLTRGRIDFNRGTVELGTTVISSPLQSSFDALHNIKAGLQATGRTRPWELENWSPRLNQRMSVRAVLRDDNGNIISNAETVLFNSINFALVEDPWSRHLVEQSLNLYAEEAELARRIREEMEELERLSRRRLIGLQTLRQMLQIEERMQELNREEASLRARQASVGNAQIAYIPDTTRLEATRAQAVLNFTVNANHITDRMIIQILSVNGVDVAQNPDFIRIMAQ